MRWLPEESKLPPEHVDQQIVSKAVISHLVQQKVPETLVSEIVRPCSEAPELLNVSAPLAAGATRVRVDPSGDVVDDPS